MLVNTSKIDIKCGIDNHSNRSITQNHSPEYTAYLLWGTREIGGVRKVAPNTAVKTLKTNKGEFTSHHDTVCIFIITKQIKKTVLPKYSKQSDLEHLKKRLFWYLSIGVDNPFDRHYSSS